MRKLSLVLLCTLFAAIANSQVTVTNPGNTTPGLAATYTSLANAITDLNLQTAISGPVTITLDPGNPETSPAGGYAITALLTGASSTNTVTLEGSGNTITAPNPAGTAGALNDAIFKFIGADFMTIQNFVMNENGANTTTAAATNNMVEWGVAVLYATATNGAQNITIQNNTITLNRTYQNTFGIYSNSTHTPTAVTVTASATGATGGNSNLKIYGNTVSNVNIGMVVVGPTAAADANTGIDIGGTGGAQANTISNFGTTGTFSGYVNVSGTVNGILVRNATGFNVSYNSVTSSVGGTTSGTLNGIQIPSSSNVPAGTFTNTITNNNISLQSAVATGAINGINYPSGSASATSTATINTNNFHTFGHTVTASGTITFITITSTNQFTTINDNTFTNISVNTTGSVTFISQSFTAPATGTKAVNNNSIVTGFTKTGAGGTVTFITDNGSTVAGAVSNCQNNNFSNVTLTGATAITGISYTDGGTAPTRTVSGNTLNNLTTGAATINAMNFTYWNGVSSMTGNTVTNINGQGSITGITIGSSANNATSVTISSNTINNLASTGTGGNVTGITCSNTSTLVTISGNTIHTLSSTGASSTIAGIAVTGAATTNVTGNTIHTLTGSGATSPLANGISVSSGTSVNVFKNKIYNLTQNGALTTTSPAVNGVSLTGGTTVTTHNNLIGDLKAPAASLTDAVRGISVTSTTTSTTQNIYYNSIFVNASSAGANFGTSGIFHTTSTTATTAALNLRNNIIFNTSTPAGTGLTVAFRRSSGAAGTLANYAGSSNNNLFYAGTPGAANLIYADGTSTAQTITAYKTGTFTAGTIAPRDAASISEDPEFQSTTGASADFLKYKVISAKQLESGAVNIATFTDDYINTVRQGNPGYTGTGSAPDMGAWELEGIAADLTGPSISYTVLPATSCITDVTLNPVTITDASGVNTTPGTKPRLYFKKSTDADTYAGNTNADNGWKYVEATNAASPFSFTTNFALLQAAVASGDIIQYFVVAQDNAGTPNIGINNGVFASPPLSVALTAGAFPLTGSVNSYSVLNILPSTITIGAAGTYPTLTGAGGLFAAINASALGANTTVTILDAAVAETGANALLPINYACGGGPYTLTIKPNTGVTTVLSGSSATPLIDLNGADNVIFDGSNNGSSSKDMTIRNTNTSGATFRFINDATNNTIQNTIAEGAVTSTTSGVILFSTAVAGTLGNSNNTISNCDIRDRSDAAGVPANAVYSSGTAGFPNASNSISSSNIFNHTNAGILVAATGAGNTWTVNANSIYQTAARTSALSGISVQGGNGHTITSNFIGGTAASAGGANLATSSTFRGIDLTVGIVSPTSVQGNTIRNIRSTVTGFTASYGIFLQAGAANIGNIAGNTVGSANVAERFEINGDSYGIRVISTNSVNLSNNTVNNFGTNATPSTGEFYFGISVEGAAGAHTVVNNTVMNVTNTSTPDASFSTQTLGMNITASGIQTVRGNIIHDIGSTSAAAPTSNNNRVWGLILSGTAVGTVVEKNNIYNIYGSSAGAGARADVITLLQSQTLANGTYSNNMIASGSVNPNSERFIFGILDLSATPSVSNYYFNSVSITGTATGANNTYAFNRNNTATVDIKNNIFSNARTGGTGFHVAIANTNAAATGWSATASNYNDLYSATSTTIGQWLGTALANNRTLTGWRALQSDPTPGSGGDANSFTEAPAFVSATNLHIPNATATQLESGGTAAGGITTDFDNETRPGPTNTNGGGTQVDVGADEFDGTPASGMTYVSSTTTQANVSNIARGTTNQQIIGIEIVTTGTLTPLDVTSFTLSTNGTTAPLTDITNAKLWYTGTSSTFATTTQYGSTVAAPNGSFSIPGTQVLSTGTNYFWLTYDVPCGATLTNPVDAECSIIQVGEAQNPTVQAPAGSRTIVASGGISGTVTIGAAGTYPSLTGVGGLFAAINTNGLSGNLTADIADASVTETGAVALNAVNYVCGGPFTILIKPTATSTLTGSLASNALIRLNGADNVTIDGSNSGGTDRSLTITNTATTAPSAISLISAGAGAGAVSNTIKNTNISVGTSSSTGYGIAIGGSTPGTSGADNDNITVQNNNITAASIGVYAIGTASVSAGGLDNLLITGNTISSVTTVASKGIVVGNALTSTISLNTVSVENSSTSVPVGISLETGFVSSTVTRNLITKSLATNSGGYGGRGITVGTGTATSALIISNNVIYGVNGTNWSSFGNASSMGIAIGIIGNSSTLTTTTGGVDLYFNSVNMFGTYSSTTACLTTALYVGSGASALNLKDNVLVNSINNTGTGSPSKAYAIYSAAANTAFTDINYNDYFTSGAQGVLGFLAADQANLAAWQTATAQDANSINADPLFNNNSFLQPQLGSPVVAAGTPAGGITIDFTGFTRSVTTPTIGAYEQGADGAAPTITYTPLTFTCATGDRALNGVAIADPSGVPTAGALQPRVYFRKNAGTWFSAQGTLASGTGISGTWDFTITAATMGGLTGGDVVQYYVIAQDLAGVPNIGSNPAAGLVATDVNTVSTAPTTPNSFTISSTLNGTYTVGAAGNYTTLTAAIIAYNTSCLTGPVVFNLIDATYSAGETFPISINVNPDASSVNTLTIKPATGVTAAVSGSNATTILKMFGADYVTIDGSNNGSTSRDLTITNTGTGAIVWMGTDATAGATNNTLKNFNMVGPGAFGGQGIIAGSGATFGSAAENGRPNSNNTIQNLTAKGVQNAVFTLGDAGTPDNNWLITQNDFGSTVAAEKLSFRGIAVQNASNFTISLNKVIGVSSSTSTTATMTGILVGSTLNGGTITRNELRDIRQNNTGGWGSNGIYLNSSSAAANVVVSNNFISAVASEGFDGQDQGDNGYGIMVNSGGGYQIYFNTVLMNTEQPALDGQTAAINIESAVAAAGVNIRNNIFVTTQTNGTNYAVINQGTAAVFAAINYNDYVSTEFIGYQTLDQATLTDWQTATTQDANSISVAPVFVSATDLHLVPASNCNLHRRGTPIAGITTDYDNDTRDATRPDMGADEYLVPTGGTMTWTGAVSTDWFDVRNWASCEIPGITSNVVINGSLPNYPNVSANVTINSLTLNTGSSLTAATGVIITLLSL